MFKLEIYNEKYRLDLSCFLNAFSNEVFGKAKSCVDQFVNLHWAVYILLKDDVPIGFVSYSYNHYFGMRDPTFGMTYVYITPSYRKSKAMYLISIQTGLISKEYNLPLEHYYTSEESNKLSRKLEGELLTTTYIYSPEEVAKVTDRLTKKLKIEVTNDG